MPPCSNNSWTVRDIVFIRYKGRTLQVKAIIWASQQSIWAVPRISVPCLCHYSLMTWHVGEICKYDSVRQALYGPRMSNDVYATVPDCQLCSGSLSTNKTWCELCPFLPIGPLQIGAIDILGVLSNTRSVNHVIVLITSKFSKIIKAIPIGEVTKTRNLNRLYQWFDILLQNCVQASDRWWSTIHILDLFMIFRRTWRWDR